MGDYVNVKLDNILDRLNNLVASKQLTLAAELLEYIFANQLLDLTVDLEEINTFGECKYCQKLLIRTNKDVLQLMCEHNFHHECGKKMLADLFGENFIQAQIMHSCAFCPPPAPEEKKKPITIPINRLEEMYGKKAIEELNADIIQEMQLVDYGYKCSKCNNKIEQFYGQQNKYFKLECGHGLCRSCVINPTIQMVKNKQAVKCVVQDCPFYLTEEEVFRICEFKVTEQELSACTYATKLYSSCPNAKNEDVKGERKLVVCKGKLSYPTLNRNQQQIPDICVCSVCAEKFCYKCKDKEHPNMTCEQKLADIADRFNNQLLQQPNARINRSNAYLRCPYCYRINERQIDFDYNGNMKCKCGKTFAFCDKCEITNTFRGENGQGCPEQQQHKN